MTDSMAALAEKLEEAENHFQCVFMAFDKMRLWGDESLVRALDAVQCEGLGLLREAQALVIDAAKE